MTAAKGNVELKKLAGASVCLALCFLLPFLTGGIPQIGSMLSPMHLPVLLCGFACGWPYGLMVGLVAPLLRSVLFSMPPMMPTAVAMAFELAAYGVAAALLYRLLGKNPVRVILALVGAMLIGRLVWGAASFVLYGLLGEPFTLSLFFTAAFIGAVPGIIVQLVLIPPVVLALQKTRYIGN